MGTVEIEVEGLGRVSFFNTEEEGAHTLLTETRKASHTCDYTWDRSLLLILGKTPCFTA
jgi:hypothetical protein